jgi:glyoxalase family protein
MARDILGIHHVTALCGSPTVNLRFYTDVLGLRLVKKTVNFDNPKAYHFYFGDRIGRPGTLITFFPHPAFRIGMPGAGEVRRTDFAVPAGALGYWSDRLGRLGVSVMREAYFGGREALAFTDPDRTGLALVEEDLTALGSEMAPGSDVPVQRAITGIASVAIVVNALQPTAEFLTEWMGFKNLGGGGRGEWFGVSELLPAQRIEVIEDRDAPRPVLGTGSVHHVAWRVADAAAQARVRAQIDFKVTGLTPVRDRNYFQSIYFREPGSVIFEIATDSPGFLIDEDEAKLGTALKLPSQFEPHRSEIEAALPSLEQ